MFLEKRFGELFELKTFVKTEGVGASVAPHACVALRLRVRYGMLQKLGTQPFALEAGQRRKFPEPDVLALAKERNDRYKRAIEV